ncbi:hypothetical protein SH203_02841 [Brevundimonas sp. SH203]|uniref:hypothetical protein n=1 Tax=Brevundimonas sp. SH203 TaxID=345167 RepID=UPI0009D16727|nr:hypothetical protein [Brevundimonas sp. SH203]GAW42425.1 hypothetical protein SH203_02841 [Brevundimonas sp. SH203]
MSQTDLDICNLAIDRVSGDRIDSFGEDSPLGVFCADHYPHTRDVLMGKYRWTFLNMVRPLARLALQPGDTGVMACKFAAPADLIGAVHAFRDAADPQAARLTPYVLLVDGFYWADDAPLFAEYTAAKPVTAWPTWFKELLVTAFAAKLADHCQNGVLARRLEQTAWGLPGENGEGGLYAQARNEDSRQAPQRTLNSVGGVDAGPLVGVRYGGGFSAFDRFGIGYG